MEIFDATVEALVAQGLMIILNNHISDAMWCCGEDDANGLWHNQSYSAQQWQDALTSMTERYIDVPLIIGNDLRNEIRYDSVNNLDATWGDGNIETDWKLAATQAANAIHKIDDSLLIFIEGLSYANDMTPIKESPIQLDVNNRLVYSFHYYSWQGLTPLYSYDAFKAGLEEYATFMLEEGQEYTAPVWLGEFGTNTNDQYWMYLIRYLAETPDVHWAYWAYNGYQESVEDDESYGIVQKDFVSVRDTWKLQDLQSITERGLGFEFNSRIVDVDYQVNQ